MNKSKRRVTANRALALLFPDDEEDEYNDEGTGSSDLETDLEEQLDFENVIKVKVESDEEDSKEHVRETLFGATQTESGHGMQTEIKAERSRSRSRERHGSPRRRSVSRTSRSRSRSPLWQPTQSSQPWKTEADPDVAPATKRFTTRRPPGVQLETGATCSPLSLFQLFFSKDTVKTLCKNTNKQAAKNLAKGKKYKWTNVTVEEFYKVLGLILFIAMVPLKHINDYWRKNIFSVSFPATVMSRDRFTTISSNIHLSNPKEDVTNDKKRGTAGYDILFRVKPLLDEIRTACKAAYHPDKNLAIDERMVATKAKTGITQCGKRTPTKGLKLFVLTDSKNGYTVDFSVYAGKSRTNTENGHAYDTVMSLANPAYLGTGYSLFMNGFYTSPKLFKDLFSRNFGACGAYRENRREHPWERPNSLTSESPRGAIRWIREDPLLFVKWMDTQEVAVCSIIHQAYGGETLQRKVKSRGGQWTVEKLPCPAAVIDYSKHMRGIDLSDQLLQDFSVHHKTLCWYRTLFFHFIDIATTNSYILHTELCQAKHTQPLTHKQFMEELTAQLCGQQLQRESVRQSSDHVPVAISQQADPSKKATYGRRSCQRCRKEDQKIFCTPWKCQECDVPLCVILDRNCFQKWHA